MYLTEPQEWEKPNEHLINNQLTKLRDPESLLVRLN